MKFITGFSLPIIFALLFVNSQIINCQVNVNDSIQNGCVYEPKGSQAKKWFDGKDHKIKHPKIKYRVGGILVYNDELHFVNKHLRDVDIYKFDFQKELWVLSKDSTLFMALEQVYKDKALASALNAIELVEDTLFLGGLSKGPFCAINIKTREEVYYSQVEMPKYNGSNLESGIAFSYPIAYIAFHSVDHERDIKETQRLFAIDVRTDSILFNTELNISENRRDGIHGLTIVNGNIWHIKDNSLEKMDGATGKIIDKFSIEDISRPTSLCYFKNSLWIITYYGGLYELPLECK